MNLISIYEYCSQRPTIYYMYMYYSSGYLDYVLLLLKLIMHTYLSVTQIVLNFFVSENWEVIVTDPLHSNTKVSFILQYYCEALHH